MIYALGITRLIWAVALLTIFLVCTTLWVAPYMDATQVWKLRGVILLVINGLFLALTLRPILQFFHTITFAKHWWFPWLDGAWEAEIVSNWSTIEHLVEAANGRKPSFDVLNPPNDIEAVVIKADASIKVGLFEISVVIRPAGSQRVSRTIFVRPSWCKPSLPMLHYVYEQTDLNTIAPTDQRSHLGAAYLTFDPEMQTLQGEYWTQRRADVGLNTAGVIKLTRASSA